MNKKCVKKGGDGYKLSNQSCNEAFGDGNEAIAWAAQDKGVRYISHYPGSTVNHVIDVLTLNKENYNYQINHALNEHIATPAAMGASLCGARSFERG